MRFYGDIVENTSICFWRFSGKYCVFSGGLMPKKDFVKSAGLVETIVI